MVTRETRGRPITVILTCGGTWLSVILVGVFALLRWAGLPGFWDVPAIDLRFPLPVALIGLALLMSGTIGLWMMRRWGIVLYGISGLYNMVVISLQPAVIRAFDEQNIQAGLVWGILALMNVGYTVSLWVQAGAPRGQRAGNHSSM